MTRKEVREWLLSQAEPEYQKFSAALIPGCTNMLGIRIPLLRKKAKEIAKGDCRTLLAEYGLGTGSDLTDTLDSEAFESGSAMQRMESENKQAEQKTAEQEEYFEEIQLQGMVIGNLKAKTEEEAETVLSLAADFIPKIDNWSVNDSFCSSFRLANERPEQVWNFLMGYRKSTAEYELRVVAVMLMDHYLTDEYIDRVLAVLNGLKHEGYYLKMGVAWAIATAYAKYPEKTFALLCENDLDDFTYNKAIQKMRESYRVSAEDKEMLKKMKR